MTKIIGNKSSLFYWNRSNIVESNNYSELIDLRPVKATNRVSFIAKVIYFIFIEKFTIVNLYHIKNETIVLSLILKALGKSVYLKMDMNYSGVELLRGKFKKNIFYKNLVELVIKSCKFITIELEHMYPKLKEVSLCFDKVHVMPNSILKDTIPCCSIEFDQRGDYFLVSGRIGSYEKNHELILASLKRIPDLKKWKVVFAGPIASEFMVLYKESGLDDRIIFLGQLEREELFKWYARSKVFILTSRWEGFSLALLEAAYMGCYVVATDVGGVKEVTKNGLYGTIISQDNALDLSLAIEHIINGNNDTPRIYFKERLKYLKDNFDLERNLEEMIFLTEQRKNVV
ncbi:glycosyltransferase family 4 protein [Aeromonas rivipollensis]|uniref:glycosyltransferase family 4 protein n=1 Tax=Aeromonas rivipollensis TaxID=948519 RepID=UPI0038D11A68